MTKHFLDYQRYHLVGIKGVAMAGLAQILIDAGKTVTGSDTGESFVTDSILKHMGIEIQDSFTQVLPDNVDCVVYTGAHQGSQNPQVLEAAEKSITRFSHAQALGALSQLKTTIAVCGVGGKSTISAMIAWIMEQVGRKPSFAVGVGEIHGMLRNAAWRNDSDVFIVEADEYTEDPSINAGTVVPRFTYLSPSYIVCTNISYDHPDVYHSLQETVQQFEHFFGQLRPNGTLIFHESVQAQTSESAKIVRYGKHAGDLSWVSDSVRVQGVSTATVKSGTAQTALTLHIPGEHNIENAVAAILTCMQLGISLEEAAAGLSTFASTSRRFEFHGTFNEALLYDDYAHHPRELAAALQSVREFFPEKTAVVAFQPHTFSRTTALFDDFVGVLKTCNHLILLDVFASARESQSEDSKTSADLFTAIERENPDATLVHLKGVSELTTYCQKTLQRQHILLTLGAGDIYQVHSKLKDNQEANR